MDSAGCVSFQPAAELWHLQRHGYERHVRGALPPAPSAPTPEPCHTHATWAAGSPFPLLCHISVPHASPSDGCRPFWTRQRASASNQPLSFDTSSVTDMNSMFSVRFRLRVLPPLPSRATRTPRALLIRPSLCCATSLCHTRLPLTHAPFVDSAGSVSFQPATEL